MASKNTRLLDNLVRLNPGLTYEKGTRHYKLRMNGKFIAIYPMGGNTREGFREVAKQDLRKAGLRLA